MNILLAGQKWFGAEVFTACKGIPGVFIVAVSAPFVPEKPDRLYYLAENEEVPVIPSGQLNVSAMPRGVDLIIAAHSHDFISEKTRLRATFGGIGYHPSLLPLHRGRDAIRWAVHMRDRVTGGTVYHLSNQMDGGHVLAQEHIFIRPGDTAEELWRRDLAPLGVRLLSEVVSAFASGGYQHGRKQDEEISTWEPSIDRPPAFRPDLAMIPYYREKAA